MFSFLNFSINQLYTKTAFCFHVTNSALSVNNTAKHFVHHLALNDVMIFLFPNGNCNNLLSHKLPLLTETVAKML